VCQVFFEQYGAEKSKCMNVIALLLVDQIAMRRYLQEQRQKRKDKKTAGK
jgi:hypothetical protein